LLLPRYPHHNAATLPATDTLLTHCHCLHHKASAMLPPLPPLPCFRQRHCRAAANATAATLIPPCFGCCPRCILCIIIVVIAAAAVLPPPRYRRHPAAVLPPPSPQSLRPAATATSAAVLLPTPPPCCHQQHRCRANTAALPLLPQSPSLLLSL
jgi:hypothetical protein